MSTGDFHPQLVTRFPSACCEGESCWCGEPASHKVEETVFDDDWSRADDGPNSSMPRGMRGRHPLTAYVCHDHFVQMMGSAAIRLARP